MSLNDQAILDLQSIMENDNEFATPVIFMSASTSVSVTVNAITNKIMIEVESVSGAPGVAERATVAVHESTLIAAGYPVRNSSNEIAMSRDLITMTVFGEEKKYIVKYQIPDQKLGCLIFVLENFEL